MMYSYVVARDYGFAPNPFYGWCTLATCKPRIRSSAALGDWVIGTGAKTKYRFQGRLIYAMKVQQVMNFDSYWADPRFLCKRPVLNGSLKQLYGDNIYHSHGHRWIQANSHHSNEDGRPNPKNIERDTSVNRVLISKKFVYFGSGAPLIPARYCPFIATGENICCPSQGHRVFSETLAADFERWLEKRGEWGLQGLPLEFTNHKRIAVHPENAGDENC